MKSIFKIISIIVITTLSTTAQPGTIDLTFNPSDSGFALGDGANGIILSTSIQSDRRIVIGGNFNYYNGVYRSGIARLNTDGRLDSTFNSTYGANGSVSTTAIQSDGRIVMGGTFTSYNGVGIVRIARLNTDGSLDTTFNPGSGANNEVVIAAIQNDGKILIGGIFTSISGISRNYLARLNTDGSLDTTFNMGSGANNFIESLLIQSDGKIIIGGRFTSYDGTNRNSIARLNNDGTLDISFNPGTGANYGIITTAIQSDGKIIIGGSFNVFNGINRNRIARLNSDGTLDTTFNTGTGINSSVVASSIQNDGKIVVTGNFNSVNGTTRNMIARLNIDGSLDTTFNPRSGANSYIVSSSIQIDGKIVIGGNFISINGMGKNFVTRLNSDGSLDTAFNPGSGANQIVESVSIQNDGKMLIGGFFNSFNGLSRNSIARLNEDGSLDTTFNCGSGVSGWVYATCIQNNGKVVIVGWFTSYDGVSRNSIARLNADGSLDTTFDPGTGTSTVISSIAIQSDGKILIGGVFHTFNSTARNCIARLNIDGSVDTTFNPGTGADNNIPSISLQSDGKILIGGRFSNFNGTSRNCIARLNTDGSLDTTFIIGSGVDRGVSCTYIQSDGKIVIGGDFTMYDGVSRNKIARLNSDGSLDAGFDPGLGANDNVNSLAIQNDGKIVLGGGFTSFDGISRNKIARLNNDGSLDTTYNPGTGASDDVEVTVIQNDGKIVIAGRFTSYNGIGRNRISRINGNNSVSVEPISSSIDLSIFPIPASGKVSVRIPDSLRGSKITVYDLNGKQMYAGVLYEFNTTIEVSALPNGVYLVKVGSGDGLRVIRFSVLH